MNQTDAMSNAIVRLAMEREMVAQNLQIAHGEINRLNEELAKVSAAQKAKPAEEVSKE